VNTSAYTERDKGSALGDWLSENAQVLSIALFFTACVFFFSMTTNTFLTVPNILNVIRQAAPILIVATAMTLVIITAGIDLSVGSLVALINAVAAIAIAAGVPWPLVVIGMLLLGGSIGLAQGWFTAYQGIPAFIVTLAGLSILRGIALYLTEGYSIPIRDVPGFLFIGRGEILGIPVPAIIAISIILAGHVVLNHTRYGLCVCSFWCCGRSGRAPVCCASGFWFFQCCCGFRVTSDSSGCAGWYIVNGWSWFSDRHVAGYYDNSGYWQWAHPASYLAIFYADCYRCYHSYRYLVEHPIIYSRNRVMSEVNDSNGKRINGESVAMTVHGPVAPCDIGNTLMHEHILNDCLCWWHPPSTPERQYLADAAVSIEFLSELRQDPFVSRHNIALDDEALAIDELRAFRRAGGNSVVDPTCRGIGRNPAALVRISAQTDLHIIMGAGYYLQDTSNLHWVSKKCVSGS